MATTQVQDPVVLDRSDEMTQVPSVGAEMTNIEPKKMKLPLGVVEQPLVAEDEENDQSAPPEQLSKKQIEILTATLGDDELDVKPDQTGAVFVTHSVCRDRLTRCFGPLRWRLVASGRQMFDADQKIMYRYFVLQFAVGNKWYNGPKALGEQVWLGSVNKNFTWGDAMEGCESIGLSRCCKRIGMVVNRRRADKFHNECCVKVFVEERPEGDSDRGKVSLAWRRLDAPGLPGEIGVVPDSPNAAKYQPVPPPWWKKERGGQRQPQREPSGQRQQAQPQAQAPRGDDGKADKITGVRKVGSAWGIRMEGGREVFTTDKAVAEAAEKFCGRGAFVTTVCETRKDANKNDYLHVVEMTELK